MIPGTYAEWQACIVKKCGLQLTIPFLSERIQCLSDDTQPYTKDFIRCYGERHRQQVLLWLIKALEEKTTINTHNYDN